MQRAIGRLALGVTLALGLSGVASASANAATATTVVATSVTQTSAALFGVAETGGAATTVQFEYGTTTNYGTFTPAQAIPAGAGNVPVRASVAGLKAGTTYHFQLLALNSGPGPYYGLVSSPGGDVTFRTSPATNGHLMLRSSSLVVTNGKTPVFLKCGKTSTVTNVCKGKFAITAKIKSGRVTSKVACGKGTFDIAATRTHKITVSVPKACVALLDGASRHQVSATLHTTSGNKLTAPVTLILK